MECQTPIRDTERQGNSSEVAGSGPKSQVRSPPPCEWAIRQQWEVVPCPSLGGACPIRGEQKEIRRTAGNSKSSPGGRGMDHFPGNYANWALSLPGKHRSIETAAYAANASSTKGAALDSMYETAQRQCGRAGPVWKWSLKRIDHPCRVLIRVLPGTIPVHGSKVDRMQFFADDCPSAARADSAPPGALDGPSADDGLRGAMDRRCDTRTEALRAVARESPSIRRSSPGRRRSREKKEGGGRVPVWRAHRWIRQMFGSIVMNGAMVVPRQRPAMNGQSAADRINFRRASRTWDLPSLGTL